MPNTSVLESFVQKDIEKFTGLLTQYTGHQARVLECYKRQHQHRETVIQFEGIDTLFRIKNANMFCSIIEFVSDPECIYFLEECQKIVGIIPYLESKSMIQVYIDAVEYHGPDLLLDMCHTLTFGEKTYSSNVEEASKFLNGAYLKNQFSSQTKGVKLNISTQDIRMRVPGMLYVRELGHIGTENLIYPIAECLDLIGKLEDVCNRVEASILTKM